MSVATTSAGARIAWDDFGDTTHPPLVLIQGLGAQMIGWRSGFCQRLADEGLHVIRFDNRDVGQSQRYPKGGYTVADFADDTAALLDVLETDTAHIVGQSMGGIIAQEFAFRYPERLRSLGLVYTIPSLAYAKGRALIEDRMMVTAPTTRDEFRAYYPASEAVCASPAYPQDVAWLTEVAGEMWDRGWEPGGPERQVEAVVQWPGRAAENCVIAVPTTILSGEDDPFLDPAGSLELHETIRGSTVRIFPGMGHELPEPLWDAIAEQLGANARSAE